jgi:uncharacterized membrane protein YphA (DoxX/SURF4 family)
MITEHEFQGINYIVSRSISPCRNYSETRQVSSSHCIPLMSIRFLLAGIFLLSAMSKLADINRYSVQAVYEYNILPDSLSLIYGTALPFLEMTCGLGLLLGVFTRLSSLGVALLAGSFLIAKAILLWSGRDILCGCFGPMTATFISVSIYADPLLIIMALAIMRAPGSIRHRFSLAHILSPKWKTRLDWVW